MDEVVFQWLGTAGFRIEHAGKVVLVDPYLTRNEKARPAQELQPADFEDADYIFVSHGHFDHLFDVASIVGVSGARVYCSEVAASTLRKKGVAGSAISPVAGGETLDLDTFSVTVVAGRHIRFDARLVLTTLPGILMDIRTLRALGKWPAGPVLTNSFDFGGLKVTHLGSLGMTPEEAVELGLSEPGPDILLPPLQGHTDICARAADLASAIGPRAVVPQHFDDFFPPVSRMIDIEPFKRAVASALPECSYYEPVINRKFTPGDLGL